jgi:hypothetical protein
VSHPESLPAVPARRRGDAGTTDLFENAETQTSLVARSAVPSGTGKPLGNVTRYTYTDGDERYVITFIRFSDIALTRCGS